jgi:hypothetical protein
LNLLAIRASDLGRIFPSSRWLAAPQSGECLDGSNHNRSIVSRDNPAHML